MNKIMLTILASVLCMLASGTVRAQGPATGRQDWMERVKAEKVAYLTGAMELTPAEAEKFWPVYNQAEREKHKSMEAVMQRYGALAEAVKNNKDEKEISALLDQYLSALQSGKDINQKYAAAYRKILPGKKVAKLYVGEEAFRRQQIRRLRRNRSN